MSGPIKSNARGDLTGQIQPGAMQWVCPHKNMDSS